MTAVTYHPIRREIVTGHEDGTLKGWEIDCGKISVTLHRHKSWITDIFYWSEGRLLFSCGVDGIIVHWTPGGLINGEVDVGSAVYALGWSSKRDILILGLATGISVLELSDKHTALGHPSLAKTIQTIEHSHTDMVRCIVATENKVYTAGYDKRLSIFEVTPLCGRHGDKKQHLQLVFVKHNAHEAGITCLEVSRDTDGSSWIFTGSFDRQVKVWSPDGTLIHSIPFMNTVTGLCFMLETHVLWIAAGTCTPSHYDPKSGDNITDYLDQSSYSMKQERVQNSLQGIIQYLKYVPETNDIIGITTTKDVSIVRYNKSSCVCCQQQQDIQCVTYTKKVPILIFTGTSRGEMIKWERLQLNPFMYSKEYLLYKEDLKRFLETESGGANLSYFIYGSANSNEEMTVENSEKAKQEILKEDHRAFIKTLFVESLDYLLASARDGKIFVWGFDKKAANILQQMKSQEQPGSGIHNLEELSDSQDELTEEDIVTYNRVAGLIIQHILNAHNGPVPALALVEGSGKTELTCLLSAGWDLKLCIWNLESGRLTVQLNDCIPAKDVCDDLLITDIAYSNTEDKFAFSATNHKVYLMNFSLHKSEISLLATLTEHMDEVTQVCWNPCNHKWITGSEEGLICVWSSDGKECQEMISTHGPVSVLCIDNTHNLIVAGIKEAIKVYDDKLDIVQVSQGHTQIINSIIIIPELNQYISASSDGTLRVWTAYIPNKTSSVLSSE